MTIYYRTLTAYQYYITDRHLFPRSPTLTAGKTRLPEQAIARHRHQQATSTAYQVEMKTINAYTCLILHSDSS